MEKVKKGVRLEHISKIYQDPKTGKDFYAVKDTSLTIEPGSFVTLLGPSGCGKTTTLRMIAGFESPDEGEIYLGDEAINALTPNKRDTAMVFQSYALLPHYNVFDNVAYGLKLRKIPKDEIRQRVMKILELVELTGMEGRMTNQLSGGQQQRVALARALVMAFNAKPVIVCPGDSVQAIEKCAAVVGLHIYEDLDTVQELPLSMGVVAFTKDEAAAPAQAAELAAQSGVLLRNLGALPLHRGQKVVYIGAYADRPRYQGGGSSHVNTTAVSALDAALLHDRMVQYVEGFPADRDQRDETEFLRAVTAAEAADVAVIFAGLPDSFESEGGDRRHMRLPDCQNNLIARVAAVQKNTVVVLHTGAPVECPWADDVSSVLCMYLAGEGVGEAEDALLWGDADPCGRLPETWPLRLEDTPCYLDFPGDGVTADYREGVYVGYRWYDARKMPVRWPFGHGLSYTGYVYRGAALDADTLTPGGTVTARVTVKNSGAMRGAEVVQLYVADATGAPVPGGRVPQALRRFAKIDLQPGEEREVVFTLTPQDISRYSPELHAWCAAPGRYEIRIGHSSRDIRAVLALQYADAKI